MRNAAFEIVLLNPNRYAEAAARPLRRWLEALLGELAPGCASLGVRFAGDRAVRQANRDFRGFDKTTDVLSFPGGEAEGGSAGGMLGEGGGAGEAGAGGAAGAAGEHGGHLGDILISVPAARRQAAAAGHASVREVRVLLLHGVLHCLGYDHESDGGEMERLERRLRRRWLDAAAGGAAAAAVAARQPRQPRQAFRRADRAAVRGGGGRAGARSLGAR